MDLPVPTGLPSIVDGSWIGNVTACHRKGYLRHVMHLVPLSESHSLHFGMMVHEAIKIWRTGELEGPCVEPKSYDAEQLALAWCLINFKEPESEKDHRTAFFLTQVILPTYFSYYKRETFEVLKVETGFRLPFPGLPEDIYYGGRIDLMVREDGQLYILDTKTTARMGMTWEASFRPYLSLTGYIWAAGQLMGESCSCCYLDGVGTAIYAGEPKNKRLTRPIANRTPYEMEEFQNTVIGTCTEWLEKCHWCEKGHSPLAVFYQQQSACHHYGGCPYRQLCIAGLSEPLIEGFFKVEPWIPWENEDETNKDS